MTDITVTAEEVEDLRRARDVLTREQKTEILGFCTRGDAAALERTLAGIAARHGVTRGALLFWARDAVGRNAAHYAAMVGSAGKF